MISVIMSVYNAEKYLAQSISSILNQTYKDFEFLIINDCSTDKSVKIIKEFLQDDNRIDLIDNRIRLGLTKNLNRAIDQSKGELIARMDADDISEPDRFEKQASFLAENPKIGVLGSCAIDIDEEGNQIGERNVPITNEGIISTLYKVNPMCHPSIMYRKKIIERIGLYDERYRVVQDYDLWFRCAAAGILMHNLEDRLLQYRINDDYTARKSFKYRLTDAKIRYRGYNRIGLDPLKRIYVLLPFLLGLVPSSFYSKLKKYDPR